MVYLYLQFLSVNFAVKSFLHRDIFISVEKSNLELGVLGILLYLDALGILPPGLQKEILDLLDFTRHCETSARVNYYITILATVFRYC